MEKKVNNFELFRFYLMNSDEKNECTKRYELARKNCENCGKSIQAGEKVFKKIRSKRKTIAKQLFNGYESWDEESIDFGQQQKLSIDERKQMISILNDTKYSQKWHLIIAYYWYSELNRINVLDKSVGPIDWEKNIEDTPWCLKGKDTRRNTKLQDPLLIIWMLENAGIEVPESIKSCIKMRDKCFYANRETDINILDLLYEGEKGRTLGDIYWNKLMIKIKESRD